MSNHAHAWSSGATQQVVTAPAARVITPTLAQIEHWLSPQVNRRNRRMKSLDYFVHIIETDQWRFTGEPIQFSGELDRGDVVLLNGQNRLAAMAKTGKPQPILIVDGVGEDAMPFLDTGARRSFADNLQIAGENNSSGLATVTRLHYMLSDRYRQRTQVTGGGQLQLTHAELMTWFDQHRQRIKDSLAYGRGLKGVFAISQAAGAVAWILISDQTAEAQEDVDEFFHRICTDGPTGLSQGRGPFPPDEALRRWMTKSVLTVPARQSRPRSTIQVASIIKGWNAEQRGDLVGIIRWRFSGSQAEDFPEAL